MDAAEGRTIHILLGCLYCRQTRRIAFGHVYCPSCRSVYSNQREHECAVHGCAGEPIWVPTHGSYR